MSSINRLDLDGLYCWNDTDLNSVQQIKKNFYFHPERASSERLKKDFDAIEANPVGKELLEKIAQCSTRILINISNDHFAKWLFNVTTDVHIGVINYSQETQQCFSRDGESIPIDSHTALFHEILHIYHNIINYDKLIEIHPIDPLVWDTEEEYRTIMGFPDEQESGITPLTENTYRKAAGLTERFGHISGDPCSLLKTRLKFLGKIHQNNLKRLQEPTLLPLPALCSEENLNPSDVALVLSVTYLDTGCSSVYTKLLPLDMQEEYYKFAIPGRRLPKDEIRSWAMTVFPHLIQMDFEISYFGFIKISEEERSAILNEQSENTKQPFHRKVDCTIV